MTANSYPTRFFIVPKKQGQNLLFKSFSVDYIKLFINNFTYCYHMLEGYIF